MTVIDYGCAMGYFSIYMAQMTGDKGRVYAIDIQEKMLNKLTLRARKNKLDKVIQTRLVGKDYNVHELKQKIDFALLFAVVHEVPDKAALFVDLFLMMKPGSKILFAEPKGHVSLQKFRLSIQQALNAGFELSEEKPSIKGLAVFLERK